jgi:hypothetical protein
MLRLTIALSLAVRYPSKTLASCLFLSAIGEFGSRTDLNFHLLMDDEDVGPS